MSEKKILETLKKNPAGLSIVEIAQKSKLHRNTVSRIVNKLEREEKIEMRRAGSSKLYYSKEYVSLHKMESGYKGKNISVGIGVSDLRDGYQAAISAAKQAVMQATRGAKPTFSLVFVSSKYNPQIDRVVKGVNKILGTENWIGCTTDREINSILGYCEGAVEVLCIDTKFMHFGIGFSSNYRKNPVEEGKKATLQAIENCPADRSRFATAQFMRGTKKEFTEIIKNPPYFILTFIGGTYYENKKPIAGMEPEFLEGIKETVGPYIPIIGASASSDIEKMINFKSENYIFANGRYYKDGAIVCFVILELYFSYSLENGCLLTDKYGIITKISENGRIIEEINNKPAVDEYCRLIGVEKKEFIKNPLQYNKIKPISILGPLGDKYTIITLPFTFHSSETKLIGLNKCTAPSLFIVGDYEKTIAKPAIEKVYKNYKDKKTVLALNFECAFKRFLFEKEIKQEVYEILELLHLQDSLLFGFSTLGGIGVNEIQSSKYNNLSSICFAIFDKLQTE